MNIISLSSNCTNHEYTFKLDYDLWVKLTFIPFQLTCIKRNFTIVNLQNIKSRSHNINVGTYI
jgi:hypothetical protein